MTNWENDVREITAVVQDYLDGMVFSDEAKLQSALHPGMSCIGNFDGALEWDGREAFIAGVLENAAPSESGDYFHEIVSIDVTEDAAAVKVIDDYLGMRFTDYLTLLRVSGQWSIVAKVFHHHS